MTWTIVGLIFCYGFSVGAWAYATSRKPPDAARVTALRLKNGQITINDANRECGYPPIPWGDELWYSSNA